MSKVYLKVDSTLVMFLMSKKMMLSPFMLITLAVFGVTASFSIFAYIWLLIILKWSSPDEVYLWEAIVTFLFFPILVLIAYAADKQWLNFLFCKAKAEQVDDKQLSLQLGTLQPGESMYQPNPFSFLVLRSSVLLYSTRH